MLTVQFGGVYKATHKPEALLALAKLQTKDSMLVEITPKPNTGGFTNAITTRRLLVNYKLNPEIVKGFGLTNERDKKVDLIYTTFKRAINKVWKNQGAQESLPQTLFELIQAAFTNRNGSSIFKGENALQKEDIQAVTITDYTRKSEIRNQFTYNQPPLD